MFWEGKAWLKWVTCITFALLVIGGICWLLVGLFKFDLVASIFGGRTSVASRVIYTLVGVSAVVLSSIVIAKACCREKKEKKAATPKSAGSSRQSQ